VKILVTGATGFVGRHLVPKLLAGGHAVTCAVRHTGSQLCPDAQPIVVGDIASDTQWHPALRDVEVVIHLAARAHILAEHVADPLAAFRRVNTAGTLQLAAQAAANSVRRFVFVSSIAVHGHNSNQQVISSQTVVNPQTPYGLAKAEAEAGLRRLASSNPTELIVVRPPLIYGPGAPGNLRRLLQYVARGLPLPLGAVRNRRSFVGVHNLADVLVLCAEHPMTAGTFTVADEEIISTPDLVRTLAHAMQRPARLFPLPMPVLKAAAYITRREARLEQVCGDLVVESSEIRQRLGWKQMYPQADGVSEMAQAFAAE
jgi:nucleoside-diphosphate-sugar epimerase